MKTLKYLKLKWNKQKYQLEIQRGNVGGVKEMNLKQWI